MNAAGYPQGEQVTELLQYLFYYSALHTLPYMVMVTSLVGAYILKLQVSV